MVIVYALFVYNKETRILHGLAFSRIGRRNFSRCRKTNTLLSFLFLAGVLKDTLKSDMPPLWKVGWPTSYKEMLKMEVYNTGWVCGSLKYRHA